MDNLFNLLDFSVFSVCSVVHFEFTLSKKRSDDEISQLFHIYFTHIHPDFM